MPDHALDAPDAISSRRQFWTVALTDERYAANRVAVAEQGDDLVGVAMSGPPLDADATWPRQLYVLYAYARTHGTGVGASLLEAVVDPAEAVGLWVADPNPRAQAFYRKHGFTPDGDVRTEDGVRELRWVRA